MVSTAPEYSPTVIDHFDRPRNVGHFAAGGDVIAATAGRREQGVVFHLSARVADSAIAAVRFETFGCPHCVAASSWLSERLVGRSQDDLQRWSWREVADALQVPAEKHGRLLVLEDVVRAAGKAWGCRAESPTA